MNILFLLRLWPIYGGGETVTICLANEMVKRGWNVSVAYFKDNVKAQMPFIDERIQAIKLGDVDCDEFHENLEKSDVVRQTIFNIVCSNQIDVVINQWWPVEYMKDIKDRCPFVKVIKCWHTAYFYLPMDDPSPIRKLVKRILKPWYSKHKRTESINNVTSFLPYVDKFVFLSPAYQREFEVMAKYENRGKVDAIPNPTVYNRWDTPECLKKKENVALVVGRMVEGCKKLTRVLKAWQIVEHNNKADNWQLEIVGDGPDLANYKHIANELGLRRVKFEGYQNPDAYYEKSRLFLMTSAFEGFPMTLVESQQRGVVPVVMDSFSSLHDIVKDGYNGKIVKDKDVKGYAEVILDLIKNKKEFDRMASNGFVSSRLFSIEKVVDMWQRLISDIQLDINSGGVNEPPTSCCELEGKTISVVMPSYGRAHLLKKTIPTYLQDGVMELILVDDCSPDNTREVVEELQKTYPQIKYLRNEKNMKQTASKNRGMDVAKGDYIYFGDDDSVLLPGSIKYLKQTLEYYEAGAVMARPLCAGPNYKERYHNKYVKWIAKRGLTTNVSAIYDVAHLRFDWGKYMLRPIEVPCLPACMLIKANLARACRFDTNYHGCAYREETDFSFRLSLDFGAKLMYDARAVQLNLPNYMVRETGARAGGDEAWRKSAMECNQYFLDKNWDKISQHYQLTQPKEMLQKEFQEGLQERKNNILKTLAKNIYFFILYHI